MAGNTSRGLIAASKTRGWDPTVIPAANGKPAQNLADFDVDQGNLAGYPVGRLPGGTPDGWPDGDPLAPRETWHTNYQAEPEVRRGTKNANPFPGMPGAGG